MSSDVFERRRTVIRETREMLAEASRKDRLRGFMRGDFDSEEEALEGIETGPFEVSDEDVLHSFAQDLDTAQAVRKHAGEIERKARIGLGLEEAA